jgi:hypothetical protein
LGLLGKKQAALIFQQSYWWLESRLASDTSSFLAGNVLPAYVFSKK